MAVLFPARSGAGGAMTDATDDASRWLWIAPDGKVGTGREQDLASALRAGELPASTWVWRKTWREWSPASRVAELAKALPEGQAEPAQAPRRAPGAVNPPPRPAGAPPAPGNPVLPRPPLIVEGLSGAAGNARPSSF